MEDDLRSELAELLRIADLDEKVDALEAERGRLEDDLGVPRIKARIEAVRAEVETLEEEERQLASEIRMQEAECGQLERDSAALRKKLYDGLVGSPKEVDATEKKAQSLDSRRAKLEDEVLDRMMELEAVAGRIRKAKSALGAAQEKQAEIAARVETRRGEIDALLAELGAQRDPVWDTLSDRLKREYEFRRSRRGGRAVSGIRDGHCTACRVRISIVVANKVERGEGLFSCENCGRLLCWTGMEDDE